MFRIILGSIILFAIGSCTLREACMKDQEGKTYKWCNSIFEKARE